jgi:hypothetical protein
MRKIFRLEARLVIVAEDDAILDRAVCIREGDDVWGIQI